MSAVPQLGQLRVRLAASLAVLVLFGVYAAAPAGAQVSFTSLPRAYVDPVNPGRCVCVRVGRRAFRRRSG